MGLNSQSCSLVFKNRQFSSSQGDEKVVDRPRAKSVLCFWAIRELAVSMSEPSRRMNVSVMAISNAVQRGEKIVKEFDMSFY